MSLNYVNERKAYNESEEIRKNQISPAEKANWQPFSLIRTEDMFCFKLTVFLKNGSQHLKNQEITHMYTPKNFCTSLLDPATEIKYLYGNIY